MSQTIGNINEAQKRLSEKGSVSIHHLMEYAWNIWILLDKGIISYLFLLIISRQRITSKWFWVCQVPLITPVGLHCLVWSG